MTIINHVHAREVLDSRGNPTVEVEVSCEGYAAERAIVPSGASTGQFEAHELRDTDSSWYDGRGVRTAVDNVNTILCPKLIGQDAAHQAEIDSLICEIDGTSDKSRLGANAILGISLAANRAAAAANQLSYVRHLANLWQSNATSQNDVSRHTSVGDHPTIPMPMVNMISGGLHAGGNLDIQDVLIIPVGAESYRQSLEWIVRVYRRLSILLAERGYDGRLVGDEGGYGPKLASNREALELTVEAIDRAELRPGADVGIALDIASSHFFRDGRYFVSDLGTDGAPADAMIDLLDSWSTDFPIISIEDGLAEDDWDGWRKLTQQIGDRVRLVGDDLFVTNRDRLKRGIDEGVANSVLIKVNQIGTLTETLETMRLAVDHGYLPVVSARSGETEDTTIADLSVATGAGQIKVGSIVRSERLAKYNQLLRLEETLASDVPFAGGSIFDCE